MSQNSVDSLDVIYTDSNGKMLKATVSGNTDGFVVTLSDNAGAAGWPDTGSVDVNEDYLTNGPRNGSEEGIKSIEDFKRIYIDGGVMFRGGTFSLPPRGGRRSRSRSNRSRSNRSNRSRSTRSRSNRSRSRSNRSRSNRSRSRSNRSRSNRSRSNRSRSNRSRSRR